MTYVGEAGVHLFVSTACEDDSELYLRLGLPDGTRLEFFLDETHFPLELAEVRADRPIRVHQLNWLTPLEAANYLRKAMTPPEPQTREEFMREIKAAMERVRYWTRRLRAFELKGNPPSAAPPA